MYTRMLIPLDGSKLAENVLAYARALAGALDLPIDLLRVVERMDFSRQLTCETMTCEEIKNGWTNWRLLDVNQCGFIEGPGRVKERKIVRYGLETPCSSFRESEFSMEGLSGSFIDFLKPLIASPRDLPNSGSLLGPKTTRATTKITISSGIPRLPNIRHLLTKRLQRYASG
jgi:Universal stress protein family